MKRGIVGLVVGLCVLWSSGGAARGAEEASAAAVQAALATVDPALLQGKTQEEIAAEIPVSGAYVDETSPIAEEVEVEVAGQTEAVTIFRYLNEIEVLQYRGNILWTSIAAFLVFLMQAGFACLEAGFTRAKNVVNICMKNILDFCFGTLMYLAVGFHLMFSGSEPLFWLGETSGTAWGFPFWIFQCVFAATTATIVSGAMAERTKFTAYIAYSLAICAVIYPIFGGWAWGSLLDGDGWLEGLLGVGFYDFAGSTVVHSIGGWAALAGAIVLGPRIGKFGPDGKPRAIPGHNILIATLGALILWFGWFGFNPGSTTTFDGALARIAVMTNIAGAAGGVAALVTIWVISRTPDASMTINGFLAGMVAICSAVDAVNVTGAFLIGVGAGILVVLSVFFIERVLKVDDPVGAVSVHGTCGAWGSIAYAFFGTEFSGTVLLAQVIGVLVGFAWAFGTALVLFLLIKYTIGLRVSEEEELRGLDIGEHGMEAYAGFQVFRTQ